MTGVLAIVCSFAGLLFWPIYQIFHRRWSLLAKHLLAVFLLTLFVLVTFAVLIEVTETGHRFVPLMWLFPLINMTSLAASIIVCIVSSKDTK